jgi:hypothetical protein
VAQATSPVREPSALGLPFSQDLMRATNFAPKRFAIDERPVGDPYAALTGDFAYKN